MAAVSVCDPVSSVSVMRISSQSECNKLLIGLCCSEGWYSWIYCKVAVYCIFPLTNLLFLWSYTFHLDTNIEEEWHTNLFHLGQKKKLRWKRYKHIVFKVDVLRKTFSVFAQICGCSECLPPPKLWKKKQSVVCPWSLKTWVQTLCFHFVPLLM